MCLARYFLSVKNAITKKDLEPGTIKGIQASIKRYLSDNNYDVDIMSDHGFKHSRNVLRAKAVDLKEKGLGNKAMRSDPFTSEEIDILYHNRLLGKGTYTFRVNS
ncbi:hypothetical protein DPMN_029742 [Dreissena polymorpha]|uniref:Uncharacterized protein n=1 Tax=Dreissena polymorpha TaxID=45954 RepID=A0A9D4LZ85_DREPO|nr:hypothetical protein DPMN_029742 [Dreissena polymorpha]